MVSVLTQALQSNERAGAHWELSCEWVVTGADRDELEALLTLLNGTEHRLKLPMFDLSTGVKTNRGTWSGTPVVSGAGQTGYTLVGDGATASDANFAKMGDLFTFDNTLRMVTLDAASDGVGNFTLNLWPGIRTSPANNATIDASASIQGVYYLYSIADMPVSDELASGAALSRIAATFRDDVLA